MSPRVLLFLTLVAGASGAQPTYEHQGALGLIVAAGGEYAYSVGNQITDNGPRIPLELGGTYALSQHTELKVAGRFSPPGPAFDVSALAGIRNSRGERFKTFFDLDLAVHFTPIWTLGARVGFGVQYELNEVVGLFGVVAIQGGGGGGLRLGGEVTVGLQLRTYVLGG